MKNKALVIIMSAWAISAHADVFEDYKAKAFKEFEAIKQSANQEFETIRRKANEDFARILSEPWEPVRIRRKEQPPVVPTPQPIIEDIDTVKPQPPQPVIIKEEIPLPSPTPRPAPIEPISVIEEGTPAKRLEVTMYGTTFSVRQPELSWFGLNGTRGSDLAKAWSRLNGQSTNNLISDCLAQREEKALCDWAYLQLLFKIAGSLTNNDRNSATLLAGFLFSQSGYKMRFAMDSARNLQLLYHTPGIVYSASSITIDGERFYLYGNDYPEGSSFEVCKFRFPQEKPLSFEIRSLMQLAYRPSKPRSVTAKYHPDVQAEVTVNQNLIDFFDSYPEATLNQSPYTTWAIYANTPASNEVKRDLYPVLRRAIEGKSQVDAANVLLHLAQSFPYGYDDEIWHRERSFFMDESWHYPLSDCEDHAIHFSRLVRDLIGLDVVLLYYPGHLASAVAFTDGSAEGDYVMKDGRKYIVCDPTIFYSNVGTTMRGMNNSEAILVDLRQ